MRKFCYLVVSIWVYGLYSQAPPTYKGKYGIDDLKALPSVPDYAELKYWVAHPSKEDMADLVPGPDQLLNRQEDHEVDVFFIYPTI